MEEDASHGDAHDARAHGAGVREAGARDAGVLGDAGACGGAGAHDANDAVNDALVRRALGLLHGPGSRTGRVILGLAGPPAAGKSTLARHLVDRLAEREGAGSVAYVPLDGFHLSNARLDALALRHRKGAPETFDAWGYAALLQRIVGNRFHEVYAPDFDRTLDEPVAARHVVHPHTRLVITEGNYLAAAQPAWQAARALMRELWYVEADDQVRHDRLLDRHTADARTPQTEALHRIAINDHPNGEYVKSGREACDLVVRPGHLPWAPDRRSVL